MAGQRVALIDHELFTAHSAPGHPERPDRLLAIRQRLHSAKWGELEWHEAQAATSEDLLRVHTAQHIDSVKAMAERGGGWFDPDTYCNAPSYRAALHAAGASMLAVDLAVTGDRHAFAVTRPPGHHATADRAMGFCLFNNVAVAARHAQAAHGIERVAIIDIDVHHGNGTEDIFAIDHTVFYCSLHQWPFYPGTGPPTTSKSVVDVGLAAGTAGEIWLEKFDEVVAPAIASFGPELILVSAGYDAHVADPLAELALETSDYGVIASRIRGLAEANSTKTTCSAWILEGGYDLEALGSSVEATISALDDDGAQPSTVSSP